MDLLSLRPLQPKTKKYSPGWSGGLNFIFEEKRWLVGLFFFFNLPSFLTLNFFSNENLLGSKDNKQIQAELLLLIGVEKEAQMEKHWIRLSRRPFAL